MIRALPSLALIGALLVGPVQALDAIQSTTVSGRNPPSTFCTTPTSASGLAINRADRTLVLCDPLGNQSLTTLLNAVAAGRRAVEQGQADALTVGGTAISSIFPTLAPRANPTFTETLNGVAGAFSGAVSAGAVSLAGSSSAAALKPGPLTTTKGATAKGDWWWEDSLFPLTNEAAIWPGTYTYWAWGLSKEFNATNTPDNGQSNFSPLGSSGPNATAFLWANANGAHGNVLPLMAVAVARKSTDSIGAANFVARNDRATSSGAKLTGLEIDIEPSAGTVAGPGSIGLIMNMFSDSTSYTPVMQVGGVGGGSWADGIVLNKVRGAGIGMQAGADPVNWLLYGRNGTYKSAAISLGQGASQGISLGGSSDSNSVRLYGDTVGNLVVKPQTDAGTLLSTSTTTGSGDFTRYPAASFTMGTGLASRTVEAGTVGYAAYLQGHGAGVIGWLSLNPSGGNVGVNTQSPGAALDVAGTMRGKMLTLSAAPTTTDIPASYWTVVKRTDDASVKLCANDNGTIKCAVMQ